MARSILAKRRSAFRAWPSGTWRRLPWRRSVTRFCPTPNGYLHHGNIYMAMLNQEFARRHGGRFEVQVDDLLAPGLDPDMLQSILDDLEWMGIRARDQVLLHSRNRAAYLRR